MNVAVRITADNVTEVRTPEQALWVRVMHTLMMDALNRPVVSKPAEKEDLTHRARQWLCFSPDMAEVATNAGFDADEIRRWALRQRRAGWPAAA